MPPAGVILQIYNELLVRSLTLGNDADFTPLEYAGKLVSIMRSKTVTVL